MDNVRAVEQLVGMLDTLPVTGEAIVRILLGEASPSGRLTNTWVRDASYIGTTVHPYWQYPQIQTQPLVDADEEDHTVQTSDYHESEHQKRRDGHPSR